MSDKHAKQVPKNVGLTTLNVGLTTLNVGLTTLNVGLTTPFLKTDIQMHMYRLR